MARKSRHNRVGMETLNIGCGRDSWGDVRLDVHKDCRPTLVADAQNLPFINGSFKVTKMHHVLEHLDNPYRALRECLRVTTERIKLAFPDERDMRPKVARFFFSLPFSIRWFSWFTKFRQRGEHKWAIKGEEFTKFLRLQGWQCTLTIDSIALISIFESRRTPKCLKPLANYVPRIKHGYTIEAKFLRRNKSTV
jgi:SAM-dependent methyltransferase